ncbi:MAG: 30S ribosomal protein S12 methylthiotransferase RimO [Clostridiales bacterium]|nr:30S ribosomal protein S12 methylthiotransferase RimO [Clostridiales bacterium]
MDKEECAHVFVLPHSIFLGCAMTTVGVVSLGCSKNQVDTELMLGILKKHGYTITADESEAEILIVNTCGFIDPAKQESIDTILAMAEHKKTGKCKLLVATGCLTQRYEKELLDAMPEIDLLLGTSQYPRLPQALKEAMNGKRPSYCAQDNSVLSGDRVLTSAPYTAYIRIADGCDNRCAYCAIPLIRGGFRSRDMESVLEEIRTLAAQGVKEHVLVAQDTSRFGIDKAGRSLLPELMDKAAQIPGVEWLRVLYCYPDEVDDELLRVMSSHDNICKYLDLPLQHADPQLLRAMNRRGDMAATKALLKKARDMGFVLRTTFITGFPGETEEQFARLMDFVEEIRFDRLGAFTFSPEEDTPAAEMPGQIDEEIKQQRLDQLMTAQQQISLERNRLRIGTVEKVLVESVDGMGGGIGRTSSEAPDTDGIIKLQGVHEEDLGGFVTARIVDAEHYDLHAERI